MIPQIIRTVDELERALGAVPREKQIGLVPTMGALHEGHISLIKKSVSENDLTVVSIFINPIQFDDKTDLVSYPVTLDDDIAVCAGAGVAFIFTPFQNEMYPPGFSTFVDMEGPTGILCGASRPELFRGVLTVVNKLLIIVNPDNAYFGEKDFQQLFLVKKMVRDFNMHVRIVGCPTVRERDRIALSSRNIHLSETERVAATCLIHALDSGASMLVSVDEIESTEPLRLKELTGMIRDKMAGIIDAEPLARLDYAEVLDADTLDIPGGKPERILLAVAAYIGGTRLIDNLIVDSGSSPE